MWRTLSDDARQAVRDLCDKHGARLYDYCRTELAAGDAEQAVAGAALTAHLYADRVGDPGLRRPWLYAVARAHRAVVAKPASIGSWSRPGRMSELLPEALLSLERPQRELLDLSVRHGLSDTELAVLFEMGESEVRATVAEAGAGLEEWFAAIIAARAPDGCPDLTSRVADWVSAPGRRARARIGRHILSCATCRAAPRTVTAAALLRRLPIAALPGTLPSRLASAQPLPGEGPIWRADGFPVQARTLVESGSSPPPPVADATPSLPVADPTTATSGKPWSAAGAAAADQEPPMGGLPPAPAVRGRHPFTPPSRTRAFRGGAGNDKLVYSAIIRGDANGSSHGDGATIRYGGIPLNGAVHGPAVDSAGDPAGNPVNGHTNGRVNGFVDGRVNDLGGDGAQEFWRDPPEDDDPEAGAPVRAVVRLALLAGVGLLTVGLIWALMNAGGQRQAVITKAAAQPDVHLVESGHPDAGTQPSP
ncbi:hypothetical protein E1267_08315 [Nonomuraea longispora]|uniref:Sigma-70 family RNA polymerase sigma factor n=1 Tax=Nonomuraea longispora TaxID=1848320 RepID=A0A4R4NIF7_9ACTN|nr:hypothetical protein [Nonomuraea longispora]TDC09138.1 hypothetical protein E1267_08315 [Nonomuraea longispora]